MHSVPQDPQFEATLLQHCCITIGFTGPLSMLTASSCVTCVIASLYKTMPTTCVAGWKAFTDHTEMPPANINAMAARMAVLFFIATPEGVVCCMPTNGVWSAMPTSCWKQRAKKSFGGYVRIRKNTRNANKTATTKTRTTKPPTAPPLPPPPPPQPQQTTRTATETTKTTS